MKIINKLIFQMYEIEQVYSTEKVSARLKNGASQRSTGHKFFN
ncbi:hypothetical protein MmTuc01_1299 [Methanosarcina mazei Tuc01]|uniref:Uncharacterized protein n=1 Tax=Methanosarcina mazei Tuc01 TaxID=1236903 RepID=M1Q325_METMZ|nr:hypothetical protein MmTuc01_1299 [Methanosarcina mazei Tuc01]